MDRIVAYSTLPTLRVSEGWNSDWEKKCRNRCLNRPQKNKGAFHGFQALNGGAHGKKIGGKGGLR
jgi:hypothetical protein